MSTIIRKNNVVFFEFNGTMITKSTAGKWHTEDGLKFNGTKVANFVRGKSIQNRIEVNQIKSILNQFFGYDLSFKLV